LGGTNTFIASAEWQGSDAHRPCGGGGISSHCVTGMQSHCTSPVWHGPWSLSVSLANGHKVSLDFGIIECTETAIVLLVCHPHLNVCALEIC